MGVEIRYRRMARDDDGVVSTLVVDVFNRFVAPGFSQQGIDEFMGYVRPEAFARRLDGGGLAFVAESGAAVVGFIEIRDRHHVALFFVDGAFQRRGIGKRLLAMALEACGEGGERPPQVTVNASPNSRGAYAAMGFVPTDDERCVNGIRFVPMVLALT